VPLIVGNVDDSTTIEDPISLRQVPEICRIIRRNPSNLGDRLAELSGEAWSRSEEGDSLAVWTPDERATLERDRHTEEVPRNLESFYRILSHEKETDAIRRAVEEQF
jgi:hypothetical protein